MSKNKFRLLKYLFESSLLQRNLQYILSWFDIALYFISILLIFFMKKYELIKSKPLYFILLHSLTNLYELMDNIKYNFYFKDILIYISYVFQFHLIISFINKLLSGNQIFKSEKDYSIKRIIIIDIFVSLIIFPYDKYFNQKNRINFCQDLIIIVLSICFYEYIKNKINKVIKYLNQNNKDIIEIGYMEPEELTRIYKLTKKLWFINFSLLLIFYILKFFDILLVKIDIIHYYITISYIVIKEAISYLFFIIFFIILYLLKNFNKGQIVQTDEEENNLASVEKIGFEEDEKENGKSNKNTEKKDNEENKCAEINQKNDEYKVVEILENENKNNEEEKLDEEEENLKINNYSKETDKLK